MIKISDGVWLNKEGGFAVTVFRLGSYWGTTLVLAGGENIYTVYAKLEDDLKQLFQECDRKLTPAILEKISKEYKSYLVKVIL